MSPLLLLSPEPVRIVTGTEVQVTGGGINYFAWLSAMSLVAACVLVMWWVYRAYRLTPPAERAFRKLCRMNKVTTAERELLHTLAAGVPQCTPLAIVVSASGFEKAKQAWASSRIGGDSSQMDRLQSKLFPPT
jgi:hypothetical protein